MCCVVFVVAAFNGICEAGWKFYGHSCYRLYGAKTFSDAQSSCESMDAALASISSANENQAITSKS